jgi:hypothetical protein
VDEDELRQCGAYYFSQTRVHPADPGRIFVTQDGLRHSLDGGKTWSDRTAAIAKAGGREDAYVSRVRPSSHVAGRAYVSKSGYKLDDFRPYLYVTEDYGATWRPITATLPNEPVNVVYEDPRNPDLLFVGNEPACTSRSTAAGGGRGRTTTCRRSRCATSSCTRRSAT